MMIVLVVVSVVVASCVLLLLFSDKVRQFNVGKQFAGQQRLDGKTVIVTGANSGIGKETARELARRGARVILACRDLEKAERAAEEIRQDNAGEGTVLIAQLDLSSLESVRQFAEHINATESRLDLLINNAGVYPNRRSETRDGFEICFGVNHLGHFLLTNLLLELLEKSAPSRVVNVSAHLHFLSTIDFNDFHMKNKSYWCVLAYAQSKLANIMFTRELARRAHGVSAFSLHPGVIKTELIRVRGMWRWILTQLADRFLKTPAEGIQTVLYCALSPDVMDKNGLYFSNCSLSCPITDGFNDEKCARLWRVSEQLVGLVDEDYPPAEDISDTEKTAGDDTSDVLQKLVKDDEERAKIEAIMQEVAMQSQMEAFKKAAELSIKTDTSRGKTKEELLAEFDALGEAFGLNIKTGDSFEHEHGERLTENQGNVHIEVEVREENSPERLAEEGDDDGKHELEDIIEETNEDNISEKTATVSATESNERKEVINTKAYVLDFEQDIPEAISLDEEEDISVSLQGDSKTQSPENKAENDKSGGNDTTPLYGDQTEKDTSFGDTAKPPNSDFTEKDPHFGDRTKPPIGDNASGKPLVSIETDNVKEAEQDSVPNI